jgi:uncharacterized membrane protein YoaK (UPF0700 family)
MKAMWSTYVAHPRHGPLPALLLVLTIGTGIVDATSILALGRVFVANMTGNIVFIGFGIAGAPGYSITGSLVALVAFVLGATAGGVLIARRAVNRAGLLQHALAVQLSLFVVALIAVLAGGPELGLVSQDLVLAVEALALGMQNAVVRQLGVPDMTTTVLTLSITGIGADLLRRDGATALRRSLSVAAMLLGAVVGAVLVLELGLSAALGAQLVLLSIGLAATSVSVRRPHAWHVSTGQK